MRTMLLAAITSLALSGSAWAAGGEVALAQPGGQQAMGEHTLMMPDQLNWQPVPPGLPAGARMAVLAGDPGANTGTFTIRMQAPAGYHVPPHFHPTDERLTIISGALIYGMDAQADRSQAVTLPAGTFITLAAKVPHQVWVGEQGLELQIDGASPFGITYLNRADDPRQEQAEMPEAK